LAARAVRGVFHGLLPPGMRPRLEVDSHRRVLREGPRRNGDSDEEVPQHSTSRPTMWVPECAAARRCPRSAAPAIRAASAASGCRRHIVSSP